MPKIIHQLSLNENVSKPLPGVLEVAGNALAGMHLTLDALATGLAGAIAKRFGLAPERVIAGAGSGALLQQFLTTHSGAGTTVVHAWPSFELYPLLIRNALAEPVAVPPSESGGQDLAALAEAVTPETKVVLLCNPNNPTGEILGEAALSEFIAGLPPHVLVLIDEAYREFADPAQIANGLALAAADERVAVVRTFSKSHGLLGLRVGYLVGAEPVVAALRPTMPFFRVPTVAQAAALAALEAEEAMRERCRAVAAERDRVRAGLLELGWDVPPSGGNFLWLRLGEHNKSFVDFLAEHGVAVREIAGAGVRVSTGTPEANDTVLALAKKFHDARIDTIVARGAAEETP